MNSVEMSRLINIIILGIVFLLIFSAFQTSSMFQTIVLKAAKAEPNSTFTGDGFISLAIIYVSFAFLNFLAPIFVVWLTPKYSMFVSSIIYVLFVASFLKPMNWSLYLGSFLVGAAASVLWTAQGNFLSINSDTGTMGRNTAIFWALFQSSLICGSLFQYLMFKKTNFISKDQRTIFYTVFTVIGSLGTLLILVLRKPRPFVMKEVVSENDLIEDDDTERFTSKEAFLQSFKLIKTETILLLLFIFAYSGFELTFFSGVYATSVGQTEYFGDEAKGYVGLIGIMIGLGEITSSIIFNILPRVWKNLTPDVIVVIGIFVHAISFYLVFLSLPYDSTQRASSEITYITPRLGVVLLCGYLLGFGDSILNTQILSLLGDVYKGVESPSAFALFYFMKSLASGIAFFYSTYLYMQWQLLILAITGISGTISFICVERKTRFLILQRNLNSSLNVD